MTQTVSIREFSCHFIINLASPTIKIDLQKCEAKDPQELIPKVYPVAVVGPIDAERENQRVEPKLQSAKGRHCVTGGDAAIRDSDGRFHSRAHAQPRRRLHEITPGKSSG